MLEKIIVACYIIQATGLTVAGILSFIAYPDNWRVGVVGLLYAIANVLIFVWK